jgi:hypothetical protein
MIPEQYFKGSWAPLLFFEMLAKAQPNIDLTDFFKQREIGS